MTNQSAPMVAAITLDATGGGIAAVSRLLWRVIGDEWGPRAQLLTMYEHENRRPTFVEKARFTAALTSAEALGRTDWILFTHVALAKIQAGVPARLRQPYAVFLHGIEAWNALTPAERDALAAAELRLANSRYTAQRIMDAHPEIGPVVACPLALMPGNEAVGDCGVEARASNVVLTVGRMNRTERYKGHDQLIDAWPHVVERVPGAQLVIAGNGDDLPRLQNEAAAGRAARNIRFTGFVSREQLDELYRSASLFALPSRGEGFGLVYLEAMSYGLPCVGAIHDAAGEVIVDGQTGRLVDQADLAGLADAIATLLVDGDSRRRMGQAGRSRVLAEFSFEQFRARVVGLVGSGSAALPAVV
jgi:phosphatidyl-myo-inositol dimannoside synthase